MAEIEDPDNIGWNYHIYRSNEGGTFIADVAGFQFHHTGIGWYDASDAYTLIRRRNGWQVTCARCGGYNVYCGNESFGIEPLHKILDLHSCGEPPL